MLNGAMKKNMRDGVYRIPTECMKGYKYNENGEIEIVEEEAKFIRKIYEMYISDFSVN